MVVVGITAIQEVERYRIDRKGSMVFLETFLQLFKDLQLDPSSFLFSESGSHESFAGIEFVI